MRSYDERVERALTNLGTISSAEELRGFKDALPQLQPDIAKSPRIRNAIAMRERQLKDSHR